VRDPGQPFRLSIQQWARNCRIVCDKLYLMQRANAAVDEARRAEFFRAAVERADWDAA
jgi:hypothetical protein